MLIHHCCTETTSSASPLRSILQTTFGISLIPDVAAIMHFRDLAAYRKIKVVTFVSAASCQVVEERLGLTPLCQMLFALPD